MLKNQTNILHSIVSQEIVCSCLVLQKHCFTDDYDSSMKEKRCTSGAGKTASSRQSSPHSLRAPSKKSMSPPPHTFVALANKNTEQDAR